ncbi:MAG: hypothetical protein ACFB2X_08840 [Rivularia sp. (in: cyanobacteria)]
MDNKLQKSSSVFTGWRKYLIGYATIIFVIIACACILIMLKHDWAHWNNKLGAKLALLLAGLTPPVYLWLEFNLIWKKAPNDARPLFEEFKHSQEVARDLWLAFVALITLLYFSE